MGEYVVAFLLKNPIPIGMGFFVFIKFLFSNFRLLRVIVVIHYNIRLLIYNTMQTEKVVDMTRGAIAPQIIRFTMPLIIGNIFVLTYNAADSIIVGRFVGANALAALGAASPIMNIMLFLIIGICLGMSVLMGNYFGLATILICFCTRNNDF